MFAPFELVSSRTENAVSINGAVLEAITYEVRSFELSPVQGGLRLPLRYANSRDTLLLWVSSDSLRMIQRIGTVSEDMTYIADRQPERLRDRRDLGLFFLVLGGFAALVLVCAIVLRRPIERYLRIRRNRQDWLSLRRRLRMLERETEQGRLLARLNMLWKSCVDPSDKLNFRSMTTTELEEAIGLLQGFNPAHKDIFLQTARAGDRVFYAGIPLDMTELKPLIWGYAEFLDELFATREREIKAGKILDRIQVMI
ncbi:MAG: hypothetical protein EAZ89_20590 [Bacteroidetes bacterium]|nr:MAG: hypothetical protein EAZ89_20590 [Bacteroidota bacterium]